MNPQQTGQSTATLDAAYDGVFSQLDALANQGNSGYTPIRISPLPTQASTGFSPLASPIPMSITTPFPPLQPAGTSHFHPQLSTSAPAVPPRPHIGFGTRTNDGSGFMDDVSRLETVTERTEVSSLSRSTTNSPQRQEVLRTSTSTRIQHSDSERASTIDSFTIQSIANRFPLPVSPIKGPRPAIPQASPKKASDLIRLFESRVGGSSDQPPQVQPISQQNTGRPDRETALPLFVPPSAPVFTTQAPPSSYHAPKIPATPPPKTPSPLSQVRTMIASWRARSGSPSQRVVGSPNRGGDTPRLFGRDRGWNVSIRRRKRHEGQEETALAEQAVEGLRSQEEVELALLSERGSERGGEGTQPSRSGSIRSMAISPQTSSDPPRVLTGEVSVSTSSSSA